MLVFWCGRAGAQGGHLHDPGFCAVSPDPTPFELAQPDGTTFTAVQRGTGAVVYLETVDGYTVLADERDGVYRLAVEAADGRLAHTNIPAADPDGRDAKQARLVAALQPHARLAGPALRTVVEAYEARQTHEYHYRGQGGRDDDGPGGAVRRRIGSFPSIGTYRALMLLIDYPDEPARHTVADVDEICNQEGYNRNYQTGSFRDYYRDVSYGQLTINTEVQPWTTARQPRAYYGIGDLDDKDYSRVPILVREAVDAAEARGLDFSDFDGDGDGDVDMVLVIHAGRGAEESRDTADIWSHRWSLGTQAARYDGVDIRDYIIQPEIYRTKGKLSNIGVLVHEFGHALGLPDLYDADYTSPGLGNWCVMASGSWTNGGRTPTQQSAWCKAAMGWTTPTELSSGEVGSVTRLLPTGRAAGAYQFLTDEPDEYYLVESRERTGWDARLPAGGVLVYHIDEAKSHNRDDDHRWVDIEQADGTRDLNRSGGGGADETDVFGTDDAYRILVCSQEENAAANTVLYDGSVSGIKLSDIRYAATGTTFDYGGCAECDISAIAANPVLVDCAVDTAYTQTFDVYHNLASADLRIAFELDLAGEIYRDTGAVVVGLDYVRFQATGLPFGTGALDARASVVGEALCDLDVEGVAPGLVSCLPNDDVCDAADITAALNAGRVVSASNRGYSAQAGEPVPALGAWTSQSGWGETSLQRTAWFKFVAPASGSVDIDFDRVEVQAAIWEADSCSALLLPEHRLGVAVSDDASATDFGPHLAEVRCLIPGATYYLQVDGEFDVERDFSFVATVGDRDCLAHRDEVTLSCAPMGTVTSVGSGMWQQQLDTRGGLVTSAYNDRQRDAGDITIHRTSSQSIIGVDGDGQVISGLSWRVVVGDGGGLAARFYLSEREGEELRGGLGVASLDALVLRRYGGDACGAFAAPKERLSPTRVAERYNGEDHVLQFDLPGSGNYALAKADPRQVSSASATADDEARLTFAPNPARDYVTVTAPSAERIELYDLRGVLLSATRVEAGPGGHRVDLSGLASGTYVLSASSPGGIAVARVVVQ